MDYNVLFWHVQGMKPCWNSWKSEDEFVDWYFTKDEGRERKDMYRIIRITPDREELMRLWDKYNSESNFLERYIELCDKSQDLAGDCMPANESGKFREAFSLFGELFRELGKRGKLFNEDI